MTLNNVNGRGKRHDVVDAVPLFQHTLYINYLFAYKCNRLYNFSTSDREK